ncbi:hypothetical protein RBU61_05360 [Tissierella sp. MB52-C2]|uniref:hypothetical protein n=1 Tax=Tissierella sp. MB52-C2 TaxID=3070999 RepID=UPI00280B3775|nr:hypothetical protein [Tissierella sp. MB52-C2]WMM26105.1 hypothetical protein RBU61_05360 [Tissierella sp. MB52-C2]
MEENKTSKIKLLYTIKMSKHLTQLSRGWKGAAIGLGIVSLLLYLVQAYYMIGGRGIVDYMIGSVVFLFTMILVSGFITLFIHWIKKIPSMYMWIALTCFFLVFICFIGPVKLMFIVSISIIVSFSVIGRVIWHMLKGKYRQSSKLSKIMTIILLVLSLAYILMGSYWLFHNGDSELPMLYKLKTKKPTEQYSLPLVNPSESGRYQVKTLSYGNANSYRKEFNAENSLITHPVDGSSFVENWSSIRTKTFGFGPDQMPLNGTVWYPDGKGTFPLVIAVHGNHLSTDYSDLGYAYLGNLLASKGYIFVSIDENFLNTSPYDDLFMLKVLKKENSARGWVILEHLKVWKQWNYTKDHLFFNKVDMNQISLIGHSRGAEAVAIAALYNQLPSLPENGNIKFDYHFNIRSIISIAGTDSQYKAAGQQTYLKDISYLAIQGSHDMDVSSFDSVNQYNRIDFTEDSDHFKSTIYVYGANHGQFNTKWGKYDGVGLGNKLYNTAKILSQEKQLQIAKVFVSSFLETTLKQKAEYRSIFQDIDYAKDWLPDTMYISDYWDGNTLLVANFGEDIDLSTTTLKGGKIIGNGLTQWNEEKVKLKYAEGINSAVRIDWNRTRDKDIPSYTIILDDTEIVIDEKKSIVFSMADRDKRKLNTQDSILDLSVQVEDNTGNMASIPLNSFGGLLPMFNGDIVKSPFTSFLPTKEPIFQNFTINLTEFNKVNPNFESENLSKVRFIFDKTNKGSIYLSNIGLR